MCHPFLYHKINFAMGNKIGVYAGSFNPFTLGHLNIMQQAENLFGVGNVVIAVGCNPAKPESRTSLSQRAYKVEKQLPDKNVVSYDCFVHEMIDALKKKNPENDYWLVRGIRNGEDVNQEAVQLKFVRDMMTDRLNSVFFVCDREFDYISSSAIRLIEAQRPAEAIKYLGKTNPDYVVLNDGGVGVRTIKLAMECVDNPAIVFTGKYEQCMDFLEETTK